MYPLIKETKIEKYNIFIINKKIKINFYLNKSKNNKSSQKKLANRNNITLNFRFFFLCNCNNNKTHFRL